MALRAFQVTVTVKLDAEARLIQPLFMDASIPLHRLSHETRVLFLAQIAVLRAGPQERAHRV